MVCNSNAAAVAGEMDAGLAFASLFSAVASTSGLSAAAVEVSMGSKMSLGRPMSANPSKLLRRKSRVHRPRKESSRVNKRHSINLRTAPDIFVIKFLPRRRVIPRQFVWVAGPAGPRPLVHDLYPQLPRGLLLRHPPRPGQLGRRAEGEGVAKVVGQAGVDGARGGVGTAAGCCGNLGNHYVNERMAKSAY